jgi:hypothetical protein
MHLRRKIPKPVKWQCKTSRYQNQCWKGFLAVGIEREAVLLQVRARVKIRWQYSIQFTGHIWHLLFEGVWGVQIDCYYNGNHFLRRINYFLTILKPWTNFAYIHEQAASICETRSGSGGEYLLSNKKKRQRLFSEEHLIMGLYNIIKDVLCSPRCLFSGQHCVLHFPMCLS